MCLFKIKRSKHLASSKLSPSALILRQEDELETDHLSTVSGHRHHIKIKAIDDERLSGHFSSELDLISASSDAFPLDTNNYSTLSTTSVLFLQQKPTGFLKPPEASLTSQLLHTRILFY